jgi:hypothetical protein
MGATYERADRGSGVQTLDIPATSPIAGKAEAVMQAMLAIGPEFDFLRRDAIAAPM